MCIVCNTIEEQTTKRYNMKTIVLVTACIAVSVAKAELEITDEQKEKLAAYHKECVAQSKGGEEMLAKLLEGVFPEDQKFKEYLLCLSKKAGFQNDAGEVQKEVIITKLGHTINDLSKAKELTESCLVKEGSPTDIVYKVVKCIHDTTPSHTIIVS